MHPAKAFIVNDLNKRLNDSPFIFVADYTGLNVIQFSELRNRLDKAGARCSVVKNSYLRLAAKGTGLPDLGELRGQNAIVTGDKDVAAAAKVLKNFTAEFKKPTIRTGVVDRLIVSSEQIKSSPTSRRATSCSRSFSASSRHLRARSSACSTSRPASSPASFRRKPTKAAVPQPHRQK